VGTGVSTTQHGKLKPSPPPSSGPQQHTGCRLTKAFCRWLRSCLGGLLALVDSLLLKPHGLHTLFFKATIKHVLHEAKLIQHRALWGARVVCARS
jgi:hypothetical protein